MPMIRLNRNEVARLMAQPVRGQGGFQSLLRRLQIAVRQLDVTDADIDRIEQCRRYGPGGFQDCLNDVFGRTLGAVDPEDDPP